jgi:site-specific recombinase XerD
LADTGDRPEPSEDDDRSALARPLSRLELADLTTAALSDAFAAYATDHAPSSVRRVLPTWRGWCRWLRREGWLGVDPDRRSRGARGQTGSPSPPS